MGASRPLQAILFWFQCREAVSKGGGQTAVSYVAYVYIYVPVALPAWGFVRAA